METEDWVFTAGKPGEPLAVSKVIGKVRVPKKKAIVVTLEEYEANLDDDCGVCLSCGEWVMGVEPDAEHYECERCGEFRVYGLEQLMLMGRVG